MKLEEEQLSLFAFESAKCTCGADEAGRGPLAGPVVAAAVVLPNDFPLEILGDSKVLNEKKRLEAELVIKEKAIAYAITFISPEEIDEINILQASLKAMKLSYEEVAKTQPVDLLLVDGNKRVDVPINSMAIVKGDSKVPEIMAASILAKNARDRYMVEMDKKYPEYNFKKHMGYPTKEHREAVKKFGLSPIHRKSFKIKWVKSPLQPFQQQRHQLLSGVFRTLLQLVIVHQKIDKP